MAKNLPAVAPTPAPHPKLTPLATAGPIRPTHAFLAADLAPRYQAARAEAIKAGFDLPLADAYRPAEDAKAILGAAGERAMGHVPGDLEPHQAGRAIDVSFSTLDREFPGWSVARVDAILERQGFRPLWNNREKDPNHYQTDDWNGLRKLGAQKFTSLSDAVSFVGNLVKHVSVIALILFAILLGAVAVWASFR